MNEVRLFLTVLIILFFILSTLLIYLLIQKAASNRNRAKVEKYKEKLREPLFYFLYDGIQNKQFVINKNIPKQTALEELLKSYKDILDGEETNERVALFAEMYFMDSFRRRIAARKWSTRMNVLFMIEQFHMAGLMEDVIQLMESAGLSKEEEYQIIKMMAAMDDLRLIDFLLNLKHPFSELEYRVIFSKMGDSTFQMFAERFDRLPLNLKYPFIDMIGIQNKAEYGPFLEALIASAETEIRIRGLKAVAEIGHGVNLAGLLFNMESEQWEERLMAAKVCGVMREEAYINPLLKLMGDPVYAVRNQAGRSLIKYPRGIEVLKEFISGTNDRYARDMAIEWVEKGSVYGASV